MPPRISKSLIDRYAAGPSVAKTAQVANLQTAIRATLGDSDWDTFLQGSYRNATAIADINDVDIVARRKSTRAPLSSTEWESLFTTIAGKLRNSPRISGAVSIGDKCVKLKGVSLNADIVPAAAITNLVSDPIAVWSRRKRSPRPNFPRTHYTRGVTKQQTTGNIYKPTVRLFKRWARQYDAMATVAPSFYIECAVCQAARSNFNSYLPLSFIRVGTEICSWTGSKVIYSVAGDKDVLVDTEWPADSFEKFKKTLQRDVEFALQALRANTSTEADRLWKHAFGGQ